MHPKLYTFLLITAFIALCDSKQCDQTPPQAKILEPSENKGVFKMIIETKMENLSYLPDQTYVVTLMTTVNERPFRYFMITAEDPTVDDNSYMVSTKPSDVGHLKTLDTETGRKSRYSDRCFNSVENMDTSDKYRVDIHWISPKSSDNEQKVRLRAMVAENEEVWYMDDPDLIILLQKDNRAPIDSPPTTPLISCGLCSEARYEVIFNGKWSRVSHPQHYPSKPDDNGYTHMVGASHANDYDLWQQGQEATEGLKRLVEDADTVELEREIVEKMSEKSGTRTLIRGKRRHHPDMFQPSHSLFRVDRIHHRFSMVVGMRPSPDWFLGTTHFELCTTGGWLESAEIPMYPWDAGTMEGVSYESARFATNPRSKVQRVEVGSFNKESPFYQMNLNDLKPFAILKVRRLDVYPLLGVECPEEGEEGEGEEENEGEEEESEQEAQDEPSVLESRQNLRGCNIGEFSDWSPCETLYGACGIGIQTRERIDEDQNNPRTSHSNDCYGDLAALQKKHCYVEC
ncbi:spondin-2-like isoform X2 [Ostrinia nubilalis]|uniref:spondin-2-like isoform X2 n=1 Tax=Ostrinia nubilalis TaxID=29057 RepID=UPI0030824C99